MIKGFLETPRHCRTCKKLTLEFYPSRVKRHDWICKTCLYWDRKLLKEKKREDIKFRLVSQMELFR